MRGSSRGSLLCNFVAGYILSTIYLSPSRFFSASAEFDLFNAMDEWKLGKRG